MKKRIERLPRKEATYLQKIQERLPRKEATYLQQKDFFFKPFSSKVVSLRFLCFDLLAL